MDSTSRLVNSLENLLDNPYATCDDEFSVLDIVFASLGDGRAALQGLLEDEHRQIMEFDRAVVKLKATEGRGGELNHFFFREDTDVHFSDASLTDFGVCEQHQDEYELLLQDQINDYVIDPWERFTLLRHISRCLTCTTEVSLVISLDKPDVQRRFKENLENDLPEHESTLADVHISFWADAENILTRARANPLGAYRTIAGWQSTVLLICFRNGETIGSDYIKFAPMEACARRDEISNVLNAISTAPALGGIISKRRGLTRGPLDDGYLPPEFWLSSDLLLRAQSNSPFPQWFEQLASLFFLSLMTTISTSVASLAEGVRFTIEREYELDLDCEFLADELLILGNGDAQAVAYHPELLRDLVAFFGVALQSKFAEVNHNLVQRAIVYGTEFDYERFFAKIEQVSRFYRFEYEHLLGDRFDKQSSVLTAFITEMVKIRQQLSSITDALTKDLSGLAITLLATSVLGVVTRVLNLSGGQDLLLYALLAAPILVYLYIPIFLYRNDSLVQMGERTVREAMKYMDLSEQFWGFPLHKIGMETLRFDESSLLEPLRRQCRVNRWFAGITGFVVYLIFIVIARLRGLWWLMAVSLLVDLAFLVLMIWKRRKREAELSPL